MDNVIKVHPVSFDRAIIERDSKALEEFINDIGSNILDFRAQHYWDATLGLGCGMTSKSCSENGESEDIFLSRMEPPNEFDWYAWDRIGKIHSPFATLDIFAMVKASWCSEYVHEFVLNGRRDVSLGYPMPHMSEALSQLTWLTKLVLRGLADDFTLKVIARFILNLKHLDISFSQLVTDDGIAKFFFKDAVSMKSCNQPWVQKNWSRMCPLASTLELFDFNSTATTILSRRLLTTIPGAYTFKRLFLPAEGEQDSRFFFMRQAPEFSTPIRYYDAEDSFVAVLQNCVGELGAAGFMMFIKRHSWRTCNLAMYREPVVSETDAKFVGLITRCRDEKQIFGIVVFHREAIISVYSAIEINLNLLHSACQEQCLQSLTGVVVGTLNFETSKFSTLTKIDVQTESDTFLTLLRACPCLRQIRVRILLNPLETEIFILCLTNSECQNTLEELWIVPGTFKSKAKIIRSRPNSATSIESCSSMDLKGHPTWINSLDAGLYYFDSSKGTPYSYKDMLLEELIQLSADCVKSVIQLCPRLRRLGDLQWWSIPEGELEEITSQIQASETKVNLIWDHIVLPNGSKFKNGRVYTADIQ